jgi:hypothetical protein
LKIAVSFVKILVWSSAWDFFSFILFFIYFINFPSAVRSRAPIQNFSPITFFCKEIFNVLWFWKPFQNLFSQVTPQIFKIERIYAETAFSKTEKIKFLLQKKFMVLKFCMEVDISTADGKLIK